jgi:hypothetical protein
MTARHGWTLRTQFNLLNQSLCVNRIPRGFNKV